MKPRSMLAVGLASLAATVTGVYLDAFWLTMFGVWGASLVLWHAAQSGER